LTIQRYNIPLAIPNIAPQFGAILMKKTSKSLTLGRTHASMALLSLNRDFQHKLGEFEGPVISRPQIRIFRAFEITFRRCRAVGGFRLPQRHFATLPH